MIRAINLLINYLILFKYQKFELHTIFSYDKRWQNERII